MRGREVWIVRQSSDISGRPDRILGKAAVDGVAAVALHQTKSVPSGPAILTPAARVVQPGHPDRIALLESGDARTDGRHDPRAFMTWDKGGTGLTGQSPCAAWRSVWHTPFAITLIRTSPCPGVGIGTSSIFSGWPNSCTTAAFIILATIESPFEDLPGQSG